MGGKKTTTKARQGRRVRLADISLLLLLASTASGAVLTLSSFQQISAQAIPRTCRTAYNTPIRGCRLRDFTNHQCAAECRESLAQVESNIQASCSQVSLSRTALISQAQLGTLLNRLCGTGESGTTTTTTLARTPVSATNSVSQATPLPTAPVDIATSATGIPGNTAAPAPSSSSVVDASTSNSVSTTLPQTLRTTASMISGSMTTIVTTETSSLDTSSTSATDKSTRTRQSASMSTERPTTASTIPRQSDKAPSSAASSTNGGRPQQTLLPGSGGGSPFDFVASRSAATATGRSTLVMGALSGVLVGVLLIV